MTGALAHLSFNLLGARIEPQFLDEAGIAAPNLALENARREVGRLGEVVEEMRPRPAWR